MRYLYLPLLLLCPASALASNYKYDLPEPQKPSSLRAAQAAGSVEKTLKKLKSKGLNEVDFKRHLQSYRAAKSLKRQLNSARARELGAVIGYLDYLASSRMLSLERLKPVFLNLEQNLSYWRANNPPAPGTRITPKGSELIFQYYQGRGLQLMPLGNFGKLNGMAKCKKCKDKLNKYIEELKSFGVLRGGFYTFEHYFPFGKGKTPWISSITQGTMMQSLIRSYTVTKNPEHQQLAQAGLGAYMTSIPVGIRSSFRGATHYQMYSFDSKLIVLNGFLQSLIGLQEYAQTNDDLQAFELYQEGEKAARKITPLFNTGAWSLYSYVGKGPGNESDLGYHKLVTEFLGKLCKSTNQETYCKTQIAFKKNLKEPPRCKVLSLTHRAGRTNQIKFKLSKISKLSLVITKGTKVSLASSRFLYRGFKTQAWRAKTPGTYQLIIAAQDLNGNKGTCKAELKVLAK